MFKDPLDTADVPPHPGEILRDDIMPTLELTSRDLARHLAIEERELAAFLSAERPVTPDLAQRLAAALGQTARYWLALQLQFDVFKAAMAKAEGVTPIRAVGRRNRVAPLSGLTWARG